MNNKKEKCIIIIQHPELTEQSLILKIIILAQVYQVLALSEGFSFQNIFSVLSRAFFKTSFSLKRGATHQFSIIKYFSIIIITM